MTGGEEPTTAPWDHINISAVGGVNSQHRMSQQKIECRLSKSLPPSRARIDRRFFQRDFYFLLYESFTQRRELFLLLYIILF